MLYDNRSGSTLLAALLNRHRGVSVSVEADFVFEVLEYPHEPRTAAGMAELLDYLERETRFAKLGLDRAELERRLAAAPGGYGRDALLRALADLYFESRDPGAGMRVMKSPRVYFHLDALRRAFPGVRLVHVVRDGRAVFHSKTRSASYDGRAMADNVLHAARVWCRKLAIAGAHEDVMLTVRYEDLVREPEAVVAGLLDGLGVPAAGREVTKRQEDYAAAIHADQRHIHENVGQRPEAGRAASWRERLSAADVRLFEAVAGRWLARYGYALEHGGARLAPRVAAAYAVQALRLGAWRVRRAAELLAAGNLGRVLRGKRHERAVRTAARAS
jgi:LPS sulfotransferase NodH